MLRLSAILSTVLESRIDLELSIEVDSDPITGYLRAGEAAEPRPFSGWVELSGAIEQVRQGSPPDDETLGGDPGAKRIVGD